MSFVDLTGDQPDPSFSSAPSPHPPPSSSVVHRIPTTLRSAETLSVTGSLTYQHPSRYASPFANPYNSVGYGAPAVIPPTISFSLVSPTEFTAKSDRVVTKDVISMLKLIPHARFDATSKRWIFPISAHDQLRVALSSPPLRCRVEALPRIAIANMLLHHTRKREALLGSRSPHVGHLETGVSTSVVGALPTRLYNALAPFQREGVEFVVRNNGRAIIADEMGLGKAHPDDSYVLTPHGWIEVGTVVAGDSVVGSDGRPTVVTGVFPRGKRETYLMCFSDGGQVEVSDDHLWQVESCSGCVCVDIALAERRVLSVKQMYDGQLSASGDSAWYKCSMCGASKWAIPLVQPVQFAPVKEALTVDAYTLGVVLGGMDLSSPIESCKNKALSLSFSDERDAAFVMDRLSNIYTDLAWRVDSQDGSCIVHMVSHALMPLLQELGVVTDHEGGYFGGSSKVPRPYLLGTISQRMDLLCGVMDTCGQVCESTSPETQRTHIHDSQSCAVNLFFTTAGDLVDGIREIVMSLGGLAYDKSYIGGFNSRLYILELYIPPAFCPYHNTFKAMAYKGNSHSMTSLSCRRIVNIIPCRCTDVTCISVAAKDHLYVCEQYAVTHNTIQALSSAVMYKDDWPVLVVAPPSARHQWRAELLSWLCPEVCSPADLLLIESMQHGEAAPIGMHKFVIISYAILPKIGDALQRHCFRVIIVDESHYLKNPRAKRTQCLMPLLLAAARVVMLTGTPALSRPYELFTQLHAVAPDAWTDEQQFTKRYCSSGRSSGRFGPDNRGASNTVELNAILFNTIMIRRLKKTILSQLPAKKRQIVRIDIRDQQMANKLRDLLRIIAKTASTGKLLSKSKKRSLSSAASCSGAESISGTWTTTAPAISLPGDPFMPRPMTENTSPSEIAEGVS